MTGHQVTSKCERGGAGPTSGGPVWHYRHSEASISSRVLGAIVAVCLVLLAGCQLTYKPILLPIEISVSSDGSIEIAASAGIATPIGDFSLGTPLASFHIPPGESLLVIRRVVHVVEGIAAHGNITEPSVQLLSVETASGQEGGASGPATTKDYLVVIKTAHKLRFLVDGPSHLGSPRSNIAVLSISGGVKGIRVEDIQGDSSAPRFSVTQMSPLPNPKLTTQPPPPPPSSPPAHTKTPVRTPVQVPASPSPAVSPPPALSSSELGGAQSPASRSFT